MSIKLDFSHFKHVKSDDKTTTLEHKKDKHQIILHHNTLSKPNVEQLKALGKSAKDAAQPEDKGEAKADSQATDAKYGKVMDSKGNKPQVFAQGGEVTDSGDQQASDTVQPSDAKFEIGDFQKPSVDVQKDMQFDPSKKTHVTPDMEAKGNAEPQTPSMSDNAVAEGLAGSVGGRMATNEMLAQQHAQDVAQEPPASAQPSLAPESVPASKGLASAQPSQQDPYLSGLSEAFRVGEKGLNTGIAAQDAQGKRDLKIQQDKAEAIQRVNETYQSQLQDIENDMKTHEADIRNGYIDPNKYWTGYTAPNGEKVPGHSRMAAAIGMIIAGFNPAGKPNAVIDMVHNEINQSLQAQQKNLDSSNNLLRANLEHYKDISTATQVTKGMLADAALAQLDASAAKARGPMAEAQMSQLKMNLMKEKAMATAQASAYQAFNKIGQGGMDANGKQDPMNTEAAEQAASMYSRFDQDKAKFMMSRIVPGVGVGSQPVPDNVKAQMINKMDFHKQLQRYVDWVEHNAGTLTPSKVNEGHTMAGELASTYRAARNGGVFKESEQKFIDSIIPEDPSQFFPNVRTLPKIKEVMLNNALSLENDRRGYGMPSSQLGRQHQNLGPVKGADGKMYQLDPKTNKYFPIK